MELFGLTGEDERRKQQREIECQPKQNHQKQHQLNLKNKTVEFVCVSFLINGDQFIQINFFLSPFVKIFFFLHINLRCSVLCRNGRAKAITHVDYIMFTASERRANKK